MATQVTRTAVGPIVTVAMEQAFPREKRLLDDEVADALKTGIVQVVNLGAGWDSRAYRLPGLRGARVFEVDLPETTEAKRKKLEHLFGRVPENVMLVPIDIDREDLDEALRSHGYRPAEKTLFVWEGVTQYLTEAGVRRTLAAIAKAPPGSRLVFTYVQRIDRAGKLWSLVT